MRSIGQQVNAAAARLLSHLGQVAERLCRIEDGERQSPVGGKSEDAGMKHALSWESEMGNCRWVIRTLI